MIELVLESRLASDLGNMPVPKRCPSRRFHALYTEIVIGIAENVAATIPMIASMEMAIGP